jgi:hypothetical protein
MRAFLIASAAFLLAGCAGQPPEKGAAPAATSSAAVPAAATVPVTAPDPAEAVAPAANESTNYVASNAPEAKTLEEAMKMGYKVVNEKGQLMYCRETRALGSHLKKDRTCLTPQELEATREANQRNFENMKKYIPPPQGQ